MALVVVEVSESTLPFIAGYLAGSMDRVLGLDRVWINRVYAAMLAGQLTLTFVQDLETEIKQRWPEGFGRAPSLADVVGIDADSTACVFLVG